MLKKTKIVATISDLRCDAEFIKQLYENGMNVVRMRRDFGEVFLVVPTHEGNVATKELVRVVGVTSVTIEPHLQRSTSGELCPSLQRKLAVRELMGLQNAYRTA